MRSEQSRSIDWSPITTSSPSRLVMTSTDPVPVVREGEVARPDAMIIKADDGREGVLENLFECGADNSLRRSNASTVRNSEYPINDGHPLISGCCRRFLSIPVCSVTEDEGHPRRPVHGLNRPSSVTPIVRCPLRRLDRRARLMIWLHARTRQPPSRCGAVVVVRCAQGAGSSG